MSAVLAPPPAAESAESEPPRPAEPRLLMTRAEFEAADACPGTRVEWLGVTGETKAGEPLGLVRPRFGFNPDGSYAMANRTHDTIVTNLILLLGGLIDRDAWDLLTQDAEVACPTGRHRFPDLVLTRMPAEYAPHPRDRELILLNPSVCVEVLSEGTEAVDLRDKPGDYLSIPSVTDYLVVAQDEPNVLHHRRDPATQPAAWAVERVTDLAAAVTLAAPTATLPLAEIYKRVFPA
ncbi:Uma2 family endonuclease [Alienimonas sp. DA493]|uniref:Uma2 family endonuclease n=1 Tax=Alienimonas sp. DA493 TaxID=3373605 RepID=UPI003754262B